MRSLWFAGAILLSGGVAYAQSASAPAPPAQTHATSSALPQDRHEGLTVSIDAYTNSDRAKEKFGKSANPLPAGILPVDVSLKNETPHPIKVNLESVQLEVRAEGGEQQLDWLPVSQVANLIVHPNGTPAEPSVSRFPIGIPMPSKDKKVNAIADQLRPFALESDLVPPLGATHGFLFFNMNHNFEAALKASLYFPDLVFLPDKKPLMFFEIPLAGKVAPPASDPQR